ncbi:response regulator [Agrobacterium radiobacter]|uniref:response regulator n=1 Tax=Agrobacterium TaxID=357 RepID=UPI000F9B22E1|nr:MULTISPECIES: response regulator [Agrobacterium]MDA5241531.1 response regulator [Agrobacterium sp. MAFF310724]MDA5249301.1 response regulator [Agrobacterium sp. MAFF210268]MDO3445644.1 response regulator [Agrobacterium sp. V1]UNZ54329.1 response regulator [Agrobacterium tumefaciens]
MLNTTIDIPPDARFLIIDDEPANIALLTRLLQREGFERICSTTDPRNALEIFRDLKPDIVLLDLMMPHIDGFQLLEAFSRLIGPRGFVPIVVLTADISITTRRRALSLGAKDFLVKPLDAVETVLRIVNLLETRFLFLELQRLTGNAASTSAKRIDGFDGF